MLRTMAGENFKGLKMFRGVLNEWRKANILCAKEWEGGDVPWYYNERAHLGLLASSVWKKNGIAFEEFVTRKKRKRVRKRKFRSYSGRQDIYICLLNQEFIGEAKNCWIKLSSLNRISAKSINNKLKVAGEDTRKCPKYGEKRIAVVFAIPMIQSSEKKNIDKFLKKWIETVVSDVNFSCCSWIFPSITRNFRYNDSIYPGIALFIKECA